MPLTESRKEEVNESALYHYGFEFNNRDSHEANTLKLYASSFGVDELDIEILMDYGYSIHEVEEMLCRPYLLNRAVNEIIYSEDIFVNFC